MLPTIVFYIAAVVLCAFGASSIAWGVAHLDEPPMRVSGSRQYVTSRQLVSITSGAVSLLFAWAVYKNGRARDDPPN